MSANPLYQLLIQNMDNQPDLSCVQAPGPCPESWPLLLESLNTFRSSLLSFVVSDGKQRLECHSDLPETNVRVSSLELGSVIHLVGSHPVFDDASKTYRLRVDQVLTLKEYDDQLRLQREQEALQAAEVADEMAQDYSAYLGS